MNTNGTGNLRIEHPGIKIEVPKGLPDLDRLAEKAGLYAGLAFGVCVIVAVFIACYFGQRR